MFKNILAFIGGTVVVVGLFIAGYFGGLIYKEYKDAERIKKLTFSEVKESMKVNFDSILINGTLCDYTESGEGDNCAKTDQSLALFKENLIDLSELIESRCSTVISENISPILVHFYRFSNLSFAERMATGFSYRNEVFQEAYVNSMSDIMAFEFEKNCTTGKGTIIVPQDEDYSSPPDSSNYQ